MTSSNEKTEVEVSFELRELVEWKGKNLSNEERNEIVKFAVEQSISSINSQVSTLSSLRQRAINIIAINGAILLLARTIIPDMRIAPVQVGQTLQDWFFERIFFSGAVLTFILSAALCLLVLATRNGWYFTTSGKKFAEKYLNSRQYTSLEAVFRNFLDVSEKNYGANSRKLQRMHWFLLLSIIATLAHGIMWMLEGING